MEDEGSNSARRMSSRTRKVASKMVAALASADNRTQAALARLDALENDNAGFEVVDPNIDDDEASLDDEDQGLFPISISYYVQMSIIFSKHKRHIMKFTLIPSFCSVYAEKAI